jgi:hypothetical protein
LASSSEEKGFITMTNSVILLKLFSLIIDGGRQQARAFVSGKLKPWSNIFKQVQELDLLTNT